MPVTKAITDRGPVYTGFGAIVHLRNDLPFVASLEPAFDGFAAKVSELEQVMLPEALPPQITRAATSLLCASRAALAAATDEAREVETLKVRALTPPPAIAEAARAFGAEVRSNVRSLSVGEQVAFVNRATAVELAALLEANGSLSGLHDQALSIARDRALAVYHIERTGLAGSNPAVASVDRLLAVGTDNAATEAAAATAIAGFKARVAAVEASEGVLQHLIGFIAAATATQPATALAMVQAA